MANLSFIEKKTLQNLFETESGLVMDFSNKSFAEFVKEQINIDIYNDPGYEERSSKGKKFHKIVTEEPDNVVGVLIDALLSYCEDWRLRNNKITEYDIKKIDEMRLVAERLKGTSPQIELPKKQDVSLTELLGDINNALSRNKPELVLDRLHTFATKVLRQICEENGIDVYDNKGSYIPIHSLVGSLKKKYEKEEIFQSSFTLVAIQNSISLFEKYNTVRNDQSYAHDNSVLGTLEAGFAVRIMADFLSFIDKAEAYRKKAVKNNKQDEFDDIPF